jgi:hypothetical protein
VSGTGLPDVKTDALRQSRAQPLALALLLCSCAPLPPPAPGSGPGGDPAAAALARGEAAWSARGEPAGLTTALGAFRQAAALRPGDPAVELWLARAEGFRALAATDPAELRAAHDASSRAAERALRTLAPPFAAAVEAGRPAGEAAALVEPSGAEALYWLALGRMGVAQATGHIAVLAVKTPVLALMSRALTLDERVDRGGPLRALGAWAAMLPVAAGGGAELSRARFVRAAELFPDEPWRKLAEATSLCVLLQDGPAFERLLGEVLAATPAADPARAPELALAQRRARAWLDKRSGLF